jgi:hypothetical protein
VHQQEQVKRLKWKGKRRSSEEEGKGVKSDENGCLRFHFQVQVFDFQEIG